MTFDNHPLLLALSWGLASWVLLRVWFLLPVAAALRGYLATEGLSLSAGAPESTDGRQAAARSTRFLALPFRWFLTLFTCRTCASYHFPFWLSLFSMPETCTLLYYLVTVAVVQMLEEHWPEIEDHGSRNPVWDDPDDSAG